MPPKTKELLDDLQQRTGSGSMSEVIRRALALLDVVSKEQKTGATFFIHNTDGSQTRVEIF
jgi:Arc/MetJ-type ribon-helix-helix transcriptional regulator